MPDAIERLLSLGDRAPWRLILVSEPQNLYALVEAIDYEFLSRSNWNPGWWANTSWKKYAKRNTGAERSTVYMHREVMERAEPNSLARKAGAHLVDHKNGQPLDNRRANLCWSTVAANNLNRIPWHEVPSIEAIVAGLLDTVPELFAPRVLEDVPF